MVCTSSAMFTKRVRDPNQRILNGGISVKDYSVDGNNNSSDNSNEQNGPRKSCDVPLHHLHRLIPSPLHRQAEGTIPWEWAMFASFLCRSTESPLIDLTAFVL